MSTSFSRPTCSKFSIEEIKAATNQFDSSKILGKGGEAKVYYAEIYIGSNKTPVAVKHLKENSKEFEREIQILSKIQHPNLVSLIGYCNESGHKILVYEYMSKGCLFDYVKKKSSASLSWQQRLNICLGAARGLQHLHTETNEFPKGIIHRDVKPGNILVCENWIGKLSDFGMFKLSNAGQDKSLMTTNLKGTSGYCAPEYIKYGRITRKIDVYAFGVVLFEVLCRKMPWDREDESYYVDEDEDLGSWAQQNVDVQIQPEIKGESLAVFIDIIGRSLQANPGRRPTMDGVVLDLQNALECQESVYLPKNLRALSVGAAYAELQKEIIAAIITSVEFKSILEKIRDTIQSIEPMISDLEKSDQSLDRPQDSSIYVDLLMRGRDLIVVCSKVKSRQIVNRFVYAKQLKRFQAELMRIYQVNMQEQQTIQLMQILEEIKHGTGVCAPPNPPRYIVGLDFPLVELKAMFLEDHTDVSTIMPNDSLSLSSMGLPEVVVLSAMPGCGKTTLAQMLCHDKAIRDSYKHIFFVPVSKATNIKVIVQRIYRHKGYQALQIIDDHDAIFQLSVLFKKLGKDPILLVLDDVWSPGLESLVCEFMIEGIPKYKILVTTRFEPPAFKATTLMLNSLKFKDAKDLLCHSAELPKPGTGHFTVSDSLVNEMVKACKGFPLALSIVGLALRGQPYWTWKEMLNKWSTGQSNVLDASSDLLVRLTTSLDALNEDRTLAIAKECFLDLGSFPEDQRISAAALLDTWVELYRFDEDGISTLANLSRLADRNFVRFKPKRKDESDLGGLCHEEFVTLHDMLRELAIHQCNQEPIQQRKRLIIETNEDELSDEWSDNLQQSCLDAQLVSISTGDLFTSKWCNMELPKVKVLILNFQSKDYCLPEFVKDTDQLKVLIITNYGYAAAEVNDLPLIQHASGLRRIRLEHISISSLVSSAIQLRNLKKISLIMCEIGEALNNCDQMFPNVTEIEIDCCPDLLELPNALCNLVRLKKLSITSCNKLNELPSEIGKLKNLKVLRLNSCTKLEELPESIGNLQKLNYLDISDCLNIRKMPTRIGGLSGLKTLHMRGCSGLIYKELPSSVERLRELTVIGDEQTILLWKGYDNVQVIEVKEDPSLDWLHKSTSFGSSFGSS